MPRYRRQHLAMLISILLPALNKARAAAQSVQCASNVRQLTLGWLMYTIENKGTTLDYFGGTNYNGSIGLA